MSTQPIEEDVPAVDRAESELSRVRILASMEDPILGPSGEEIVLSSGDVHLLTPDVADILVASGVAEAANL